MSRFRGWCFPKQCRCLWQVIRPCNTRDAGWYSQFPHKYCRYHPVRSAWRAAHRQVPVLQVFHLLSLLRALFFLWICQLPSRNRRFLRCPLCLSWISVHPHRCCKYLPDAGHRKSAGYHWWKPSRLFWGQVKTGYRLYPALRQLLWFRRWRLRPYTGQAVKPYLQSAGHLLLRTVFRSRHRKAWV